METTLTQERLKDLLEYLPELGRFKRKKTTAQYKAGDIAGSYDCTNGYRRLMVNKKVYKEHILVWFYHTGHWPNNQIDHINCIKDDNRLENLEWCTNLENEKHAINSGLKNFKGINNPKCKFTEEEIKKIKFLIKEGKMKQKNIGKLFGVAPAYISQIKLGKIWKHIE